MSKGVPALLAVMLLNSSPNVSLAVFPGLVSEYSMCGSSSGMRPQGLSPVVSAEWARLVLGKGLSRMGEAAGTQFVPGVAAFQSQSYFDASSSSPGPEA